LHSFNFAGKKLLQCLDISVFRDFVRKRVSWSARLSVRWSAHAAVLLEISDIRWILYGEEEREREREEELCVSLNLNKFSVEFHQ
jgi:hypothetical protein